MRLLTQSHARNQIQTRSTLVVLSLALAAFILLFATRATEQTRDSLVYAFAAKTGQELFHPHHLLYTPIIRLFYLVTSPVCSACDAILAAQIHNILWATAGIAAFYLVLRQLSRAWRFSALIALGFNLLLLVTRGYWELATQTTMYVPSAAILMVLTAVLLPSARPLSRLRLLAAAGLLALAVLYHQSNVLFTLPLAYFLTAGDAWRHWHRWKRVLSLTTAAALLVLAFYGLAFLTTGRPFTIAEFVRFCLTYTSEICLGGQCKASPDNWGTLNNFGSSGVSSLLASLSWIFVVLPEQLGGQLSWLVGAGLLLLLGWHTVQAVRSARRRRLRLFCLLWVLAYGLFFFWWLPDYEHPFVVTLPPMLLLVFVAAEDVWTRFSGRQQRVETAVLTVLALGILVLGGRNFFTRIAPLHQFVGDSYQEAAQLVAPPSANCLYLTSYRTWNHLRYYYGQKNALQAKHPMSFFYQETALPAEYNLANESCVMVPLSFVLPTYTNTDYSTVGVNGYTAPERWLAYITWLFDLQYDSEQQLMSSRQFEVITIGDGEPYLYLDQQRLSVAGLPAFVTMLDAQLQDENSPFQSWLQTTKVTR